MENFWSSCVSQLRLQFGDTVFDAFISPTQAKMTDNTHLLLQAPNEATVRWLSENIL
jgi:chromosomal replication initiation ATPase DnaA